MLLCAVIVCVVRPTEEEARFAREVEDEDEEDEEEGPARDSTENDEPEGKVSLFSSLIHYKINP